jgi:hypothetical protein
MAIMAYAAAQTPPAAPAKKFKDDAEAALAVAANNEKDPKAQIEKLDKWKHDYPETQYDEDRIALYYAAYGSLKQYHDQLLAGEELRKKLPDKLMVLRGILVAFGQITSPTAEDRAIASGAAHYIVEHQDAVFAADQAKSAGMTDDQWKALKPQMLAYANAQIDKIAEDQGPDAVLALLKQDPTRVELNGWLGQQYVTQGKTDPTKIVLALFHYARVAQYDGPNAAPAATKAGSKKYFDKQYAGYHGSMDGADQVLATAKANAVPPDGFDIESITSISKKKIEADEEKRKANPMITLWTDTKTALTGDGGAAYFDQIKDALMPGAAIPGVTKFKGKIVSMTPAAGRPKKIVLAVEKDGVADCTLVLETPLPGKMDVGSELEFDGTVKEYTKDPYMLTFAVEKDNILGWTGKNPPAGARPPKKSD